MEMTQETASEPFPSLTKDKLTDAESSMNPNQGKP